MLKLKACPRCGGDVHANRDAYGNYEECLQCGWMRDVEDPKRLARLLEFAAEGKGKSAA